MNIKRTGIKPIPPNKSEIYRMHALLPVLKLLKI